MASEGVEGADDLLDVLGQQVVLRAALAVSRSALMNSTLPWRSAGRLRASARGAAPGCRRGCRCRRTGWRQADHRVEQVVVEDAGADVFAPHRRETARRAASPWRPCRRAQHREHVLHEHQVGLLAARGT
jgi:hypothetical protein